MVTRFTLAVSAGRSSKARFCRSQYPLGGPRIPSLGHLGFPPSGDPKVRSLPTLDWSQFPSDSGDYDHSRSNYRLVGQFSAILITGRLIRSSHKHQQRSTVSRQFNDAAEPRASIRDGLVCHNTDTVWSDNHIGSCLPKAALKPHRCFSYSLCSQIIPRALIGTIMCPYREMHR
jgi:hypothetical protein